MGRNSLNPICIRDHRLFQSAHLVGGPVDSDKTLWYYRLISTEISLGRVFTRARIPPIHEQHVALDRIRSNPTDGTGSSSVTFN
jgi:hypothetical protein